MITNKYIDDMKTARNLGKSARLHCCKRIPAWDESLMKMLASSNNSGRTLYLLDVWLKGWDEENLKNNGEAK